MRNLLIALIFSLLLTSCATATKNSNLADRRADKPSNAGSTYIVASEFYDANGNYLAPEAYDDPFGLEHYIQTHRYDF